VLGRPAGIGTFEQLTAAGLRVNVTLIFSLAHYEAVARAYLRGSQAHVHAVKELGIDLAEVGESLQADGVRLFAEAYKKIMTSLQAPSRD